jgi:hypothetical protein
MHKSSYNAKRKITPAQRLAEIACERQANLLGKTLIPQFWNTPEWKKRFIDQVRHANELLKIYDFNAITDVFLKHPRYYSMGTAFFKRALEDSQFYWDVQKRMAKESAKDEVSRVDERPRSGPVRKLGEI